MTSKEGLTTFYEIIISISLAVVVFEWRKKKIGQIIERYTEDILGK